MSPGLLLTCRPHPGLTSPVASTAPGTILRKVSWCGLHNLHQLIHVSDLVGPFAVRTGQKVYVNDSALHLRTIDRNDPQHREPDIRLHFHLNQIDTLLPFGSGLETIQQDATITAFTSQFAGDPAIRLGEGEQTLRFSDASPSPVIRADAANRKGCLAYSEGSVPPDAVLFVERGDCTFLQKLSMGSAVGAAGVIVASETEEGINPTAEPDEQEYARTQLSDVALVVVSRSAARMVSEMLEFASRQKIDVLMSVEHEGTSTSPHAEPQDENTNKNAKGGKLLYVNGRPLINTELLV